MERLLRVHYPQVCRLAYALCGNAERGRWAVTAVMRRSLHILPSWQSDVDAINWFLHHTVLAARQGSGDVPPAPAADCLITQLPQPSPPYVAMICVLRQLPRQQQEAFVLSRGEKLEPRRIGVAMDCSTAAAANHLIAANKSLGVMAAQGFDELTQMFARAYASLTPADELIVREVGVMGKKLRRMKWRSRAWRLLGWTILALIAWAIWKLSRMIVV